MPLALESLLPPLGDTPYPQLPAWVPFLDYGDAWEMEGDQRERGTFEVHRLVQTLRLSFASRVNLGNLVSVSEALSPHL